MTTTTTDPEPDNDTDDESTTIGALSDLSLTKTAAVAEVLQGGTVAFTFHVENAGPSDATGVEITDPLPPGASFVTAGSDARCADVAGV